MPAIDEWRFLILLGEMRVTLGGGQYASPSTFGELAGLFGGEISEAALSSARASGRLVEGRKVLSRPLIEVLSFYSGVQVELVRHGFEDEPELVVGSPGDQLASIQDEGEDETELCPASLRWYAKFRNDDPFIFVSAEKDLCAKIVETAPDVAMLVSRDFIYAS